MKQDRRVPAYVLIVPVVAILAAVIYTHAHRAQADVRPQSRIAASTVVPEPAKGPAQVLYLEVGRPVRLTFNREVPADVVSSTSNIEVNGRDVTFTPSVKDYGFIQLSNDRGEEIWSVSYIAWPRGEAFPDDARTTPVAGGFWVPVRVKDAQSRGLEAKSTEPIKWGEISPRPMAGGFLP